jgi:hypothetical protein
MHELRRWAINFARIPGSLSLCLKLPASELPKQGFLSLRNNETQYEGLYSTTTPILAEMEYQEFCA